ncbi:hypothetical protein [Falsiroseomonas sp. HW251]|uniref:hypothetical protein n=1 Tax=Falsiroseomonas sp. HW251 TaxID=3390998 RepID=UPI003D30EF93
MSRALDHAIACLAERRTPDNLPEFFALPIALAIAQLDGLVAPATARGWRRRLAETDPFRIYRTPVGGHDGPGISWNCLAAAGEFRLAAIGARRGLDFVDASVNGQGRYFDNEFDLYAEGPLVYDAFPRAWLAELPPGGYAGPAAAELTEALDRAALASLFLQAPGGEAPIGGRSAHHQWADALQAAIFEAAAARAAGRGDAWLAGVFKRAARRAAAAMLPWRRDSGEWFVVKNRVTPELRHGFEPYSAHSQYNLLAACNLALAWLHAGATEDVAERLTPAETGGHVLVLPSPFSCVVATCGGTQVTFFLSPHATQTPAGLARIVFDGMPATMGPGDGIALHPAHELPGGTAEPVSTGLAWREGERWTSLAHLEAGAASASIAIEREDPALLRFALTWSLAPGGRITQHVQMRPGEIMLDFEAEGLAEALALRWPVFAGDGDAPAAIEAEQGGCSVAFRGARLRYRVAGAGPVRLSEETAHRNGWVRIATAEATGPGPLRLVISRG